MYIFTYVSFFCKAFGAFPFCFSAQAVPLFVH